jgi:diguanylate cyclase (GGDEF)-like protein
MVLINDKKNIIAANKIFFQYFKQYKTIEEFKKDHTCICEYFVEAKGYLSKGDDTNHWLDYLLANMNKQHKVKMDIDGEIYYFLLNVSLISEEKEHFSIVFSDITEQEIYKKELEERSLQDPLTGLGNRRKYQSRVEDEMVRECRYKIPFSIISFDIDHFKKVNDTYGHLKGDEVLKEYTHLVQTHLRELDEVFRVGGEEFLIITPNTTIKDAACLAEKLRKIIEEHKKVVPITASFGVSEYHECEDEEELLKRADDALYEAKNSGRNRVVMR